MTATFIGHPLMGELLANPAKFNEQGRAYELLQAYFQGYPVETLRPLLAHQDDIVRRAAVWIVSELGEQGCSLLDDVIPLFSTGDRYLTYHALEIAIVCAVGKHVDKFTYVARALENRDEIIRVLAMRLIANADESQIAVGYRLGDATGHLNEVHRKGLEQLRNCDSLKAGDVLKMLRQDNPLIRRYGAIAIKRLSGKFPNLMEHAANVSDADISRFARESLQQRK